MASSGHHNDAPTDDGLLQQLYDELRRLAAAKLKHERQDHTLSPTALVHEAWLRLGNRTPGGWASQAQFFSAAAEAMRRVLVDSARAKARLRRGGGAQKVTLSDLAFRSSEDPERTLAIDEGIERLAAVDARLAELVKLRLYAGLDEGEAAGVLGVSTRTARRDWQYARAWLFRTLAE